LDFGLGIDRGIDREIIHPLGSHVAAIILSLRSPSIKPFTLPESAQTRYIVSKPCCDDDVLLSTNTEHYQRLLQILSAAAKCNGEFPEVDLNFANPSG
jgi:hypothetical protein